MNEKQKLRYIYGLLERQFRRVFEIAKRERGVTRCVAVWCGSTETWRPTTEVHQSLEAFERGLRESSDDIAPSAIYAYACLRNAQTNAKGFAPICKFHPERIPQ